MYIFIRLYTYVWYRPKIVYERTDVFENKINTYKTGILLCNLYFCNFQIDWVNCSEVINKTIQYSWVKKISYLVQSVIIWLTQKYDI